MAGKIWALEKNQFARVFGPCYLATSSWIRTLWAYTSLENGCILPSNVVLDRTLSIPWKINRTVLVTLPIVRR